MKFKREDRYIILKCKDLENLDIRIQCHITEYLDRVAQEIPHENI